MLSHRNLLAGSRIVIKYLKITERDRVPVDPAVQLRLRPQSIVDRRSATRADGPVYISARRRNRPRHSRSRDYRACGRSYHLGNSDQDVALAPQDKAPDPALHHQFRWRGPLRDGTPAARDAERHPHIPDVRPNRSFPLHLSASRGNRQAADFDRQGHSRIRGVRRQVGRSARQAWKARNPWFIAGRRFRWDTGTGPRIPPRGHRPSNHWQHDDRVDGTGRRHCGRRAGFQPGQ